MYIYLNIYLQTNAWTSWTLGTLHLRRNSVETLENTKNIVVLETVILFCCKNRIYRCNLKSGILIVFTYNSFMEEPAREFGQRFFLPILAQVWHEMPGFDSSLPTLIQFLGANPLDVAKSRSNFLLLQDQRICSYRKEATKNFLKNRL